MGVGLRELYYGTLFKEINIIEEKKQQLDIYEKTVLKRKRKIKSMIVSIIIFLIICFKPVVITLIICLFFISIPLLIALYVSIWTEKDDYLIKGYEEYNSMINKYKFFAIDNITKDIDESLEIDYREEIDIEDIIMRSGIFKERIDKYSYGGIFKGKIENTEYKFFNISLKQHIKDKSYKDIYDGLFLIADFNKNFNNRLIIKSKDKNFIKDIVNGGIHDSSGKEIKLENIIFEEYFDVYGEDEVEIRYILTPLLMEKLVNIKERIKEDIQIVFHNNKIEIAIPKIIYFDNEIIRLEVLQENYEVISEVVKIIKDLDLNTRIWSKE